MDISKVDPRTLLSASKPELDPEARKTRDLKSLKQSTQEFEALFVNEMFKSMRKTIPDSGLIEKNTSEKIYQEMLDMEMARTASQGKGIGLADAMFEQLRHLVEDKRYNK